MFKSIFPSSIQNAEHGQVLLAFGIALLLGLVISFINYRTLKNKTIVVKMTQTLFVLPLLVAVIIFLVGTNMASALSLGGAFAIIRFRSQAEPKDISYVLASMGCGLACGLGFVGYGVIIAVVFCLIMIVLSFLNYGEDNYKLLKIKVPENFSSKETFDDVITKYVSHFKLLRFKTVDLGTVYEFHYLIKEKSDSDLKQFFDELRCHNGNLPIALVDYIVNNQD